MLCYLRDRWLTLANNIESEKLAASQQPDVDFLDEFSYSFLSLNRGFLDNRINGRFPDDWQWLQTTLTGPSSPRSTDLMATSRMATIFAWNASIARSS
jgi:hypothetical protein